MKITSQKGIELIKNFETLHDGDLSLIGLQPKMCPAGIWTEGYGHAILDKTGKQIKGAKNKYLAYDYSIAYTESEAETLLADDLGSVEKQINRLNLYCTQDQFDAIVSFTFNLGIGNLRSSTLLKLIKQNPLNFMIAYEFTKWRKAGGRILAGLERRRREEAQLYFTGRLAG
jgi:lysozyme